MASGTSGAVVVSRWPALQPGDQRRPDAGIQGTYCGHGIGRTSVATDTRGRSVVREECEAECPFGRRIDYRR